MKAPTAWDLKIIADIEKAIARLESVVAGKGDADIVRDTLGDSRNESVHSMKRRIVAKVADLKFMKDQFPDFYGK
jgi:hypothetical protein